jgi:tetratricopeptide (TPR) repeat protein
VHYSSKEYEFLGKQVAAGRYVARSTFILALILTLLVGAVLGRYLFPNEEGLTAQNSEQKKPLDVNSPITAAVNPDKQIIDSILRHEEDVRQDPKNAEAWEHLGNLYFDANEPAKSVHAYTKALELVPGKANVMVDCGVMYRKLRQYDKALEFFQNALAVEPKHEAALFNSGIVLYYDLNRKEDALESWRVIVRNNPDAKTPSGDRVSDVIKKLTSAP